MIKKRIVSPNLVIRDKAGNLKRVEFVAGNVDDKSIVQYKVLKHVQPWREGLVIKTSLKKFAEFIYGVYVDGDKFTVNDVIEMNGNGEKFVVLKNDGTKGKLRSLSNGFVLDNFYWKHGESRFLKTGSIQLP
jgi:hypothetical protein